MEMEILNYPIGTRNFEFSPAIAYLSQIYLGCIIVRSPTITTPRTAEVFERGLWTPENLKASDIQLASGYGCNLQ